MNNQSRTGAFPGVEKKSAKARIQSAWFAAEDRLLRNIQSQNVAADGAEDDETVADALLRQVAVEESDAVRPHIGVAGARSVGFEIGRGIAIAPGKDGQQAC